MKSNCSNGEVRLVDGASNVSGRVEVCRNRAWASVCSTLWRFEDATVVCRQLGLQMHEGGVLILLCVLISVNACIQILKFACHQTTPVLGVGQSLGFGSAAVAQSPASANVAFSVGAFPEIVTTLMMLRCNVFVSLINHTLKTVLRFCMCFYMHAALCSDGDVELFGLSTSRAGMVRVCINGTWGKVCNGERDPHFASIVCKQLGFSPHGMKKCGPSIFVFTLKGIADLKSFSLGSNAARGIWNDNVYGYHMYQPVCSSSDDNILDCVYSATDTTDSGSCSSSSFSYDATSVVCVNGKWENSSCVVELLTLFHHQMELQ